MAAVAAMENLKRAVRAGDMKALSAGRLDELRLELNEGVYPDHYAALHWACHYRNAEAMQHFLDLGASPGVRSAQGWTPAHVCAIRGCAICLQILKDAGVDLSARDKRGYTCSHLAAIHGKCSVMQVLIKEGVDLLEVDRRKWGVVHHASFHGRLGILQLLMKLVEVAHNVPDAEGNTPAHLAAAEGHLDCLRLLVYYKNEPAEVIGARNDKGSTPKDLAEQFHKQACVEFLTLAESDVESFEYEETGGYKAHVAAKEGNLQLLSMLIKESHCGINDRDSQGSTPLHKAAGNGQLECLQWLIDHSADLYLRNQKGESARDVALRFGKLECAALLRSHTNIPGQQEEDKKDEVDAEDDPSAESIERAKERVESLQTQFMAAKSRLRELGGELFEDNEIELLKTDHQRIVEDLENKLQFERERRENLEADMDQLRKQLHHSTALLQQHHASSNKGDSSLESTPDHLLARLQNKMSKKPRGNRNNKSAGSTTPAARPFIK